MNTENVAATVHCSECVHFALKPVFKASVAECASGHSPRFYAPKSPLDKDWGWKRKCNDFERKL